MRSNGAQPRRLESFWAKPPAPRAAAQAAAAPAPVEQPALDAAVAAPAGELRVFTRKRRVDSLQPAAAAEERLPEAADCDGDAGAPAGEAFPLSAVSPPPVHQPPPARRVHAPAAAAGRTRQLHLDLGQADFGHATCAQCSMVYARGEAADERLHAVFHAAALEAPPFKGWQRERVVWQCDVSAGAGRPRRILQVSPGDPLAHWARVHQLGELAAAALGLAEGWLLEEASEAHAFVAVSAQGRVEGLLVAERLAFAHRLLPQPAGGGGVLRFERRLEAAAAGVRCVWVHPLHRRGGTARRLLDAVRAGMVAGAHLPASMLAFSQPTPAGRALAAAYTGTDAFLVYDGTEAQHGADK